MPCRKTKKSNNINSNNNNGNDGGKIVPQEDVPPPSENEGEDDTVLMPPESQLGAVMSDRTTKKVIFGILLMLIVLPFALNEEGDSSNHFGVRVLHDHRSRLSQTFSSSEDDDTIAAVQGAWKRTEEFFIKQSTNCILLRYSGFTDGEVSEAVLPDHRADPESLRTVEKTKYAITDDDPDYPFRTEAIFDLSEETKQQARLGIVLTSFTILLLGIGTMEFARVVNNLVIIPVERMIQLVNEIANNPLDKHEYSASSDKIQDTKDVLETHILHQTLTRLSQLLRVGLGEAGAEIAARHLNDEPDYHHQHRRRFVNGKNVINLLGKGKKVDCVFAFCDIRRFTDTTECLQEEIFIFVNKIAHILHSIVIRCDGIPSKNVGDAFLLVWKIDSFVSSISSSKDHNYSGDRALYAMLKTVVEMKRHSDHICSISAKASRNLHSRMNGYQCRMGFGLHFGWAIEGVIGSHKKIDVAYCSPHAAWVEYLESITKDYGVDIVMSNAFVRLLSPEARYYCRQIDVIKKPEQSDPVAIFTYDIIPLEQMPFSIEPPPPPPSPPPSPPPKNKSFSVLSRRSTKGEKRENVSKQNDGTKKDEEEESKNPEITVVDFTPSIWNHDEEMCIIRVELESSTRQCWSDGMKHYVDGDWKRAQSSFQIVMEQTNRDGGGDKQARRMIERMEGHNFCAPPDWPGYQIV